MDIATIYQQHSHSQAQQTNIPAASHSSHSSTFVSSSSSATITNHTNIPNRHAQFNGNGDYSSQTNGKGIQTAQATSSNAQLLTAHHPNYSSFTASSASPTFSSTSPPHLLPINHKLHSTSSSKSCHSHSRSSSDHRLRDSDSSSSASSNPNHPSEESGNGIDFPSADPTTTSKDSTFDNHPHHSRHSTIPNIYSEWEIDEEPEHDLVSNYNQLSYIRYPPYIFSLRCTRWFYMFIGILQEPWPWRAHRSLARSPNELRIIMYAQWTWSLICFMFVLFYAFTVLQRGQNFYLGDSDHDKAAHQENQHRNWLWLVSCISMLMASLCSAVLAHYITSHRSLSTRIYHVIRNSRTQTYEESTSSSPVNLKTASSSLDVILFSSLGLCVLLAVFGIVRDLWLYRPILFNTPADSFDFKEPLPSISGTTYVLFLLSTVFINFQLASGVTIFRSLVSVHILRILGAIEEIKQEECVMQDAIHQVVDVQLSLTALKSQTETLLAYILFASAMLTVLPLLYILAITTEVNHNHSLFLLLQPVCIIFLVLIQVARINKACQELKETASLFTLLQRHQSGNIMHLRKFEEYLRIGVWDFRLLGIRVTTFQVGALLAITFCALLALLQFGYLSSWPY